MKLSDNPVANMHRDTHTTTKKWHNNVASSIYLQLSMAIEIGIVCHANGKIAWA